MPHLAHPISVYGTAIVIALAFLLHWIASRFVSGRANNFEEAYRKRKFFTTIVVALAAIAIIVLWARLLQSRGTVLGLIGAGLAVALREPLLSIAGRIAIFAGHMYSAGDRIEIMKISGDVVDVGFFYTRMMEIGNWVQADQATGRIVQFSNSIIFANHVYNYTQNFSYLWDELHLMVTYASDVEGASKILMDAGEAYSREFLHRAEEDLERLQHTFLVPTVELKPAVFVKVTDNWVELSLRYIVDPKKRRPAATFLWQQILPAVQAHLNIEMASTTMELTVHMDAPDERERKRLPPQAA